MFVLKLKESTVRIYVGNLSFGTTSDDLRAEFEAFGQVTSVQLITDRDTGKSKGFAFVEMPSSAEAQTAVAELNGKNLHERAIVVNEARPQSDSRSGERGDRSGGYGSSGFRR
jgi:cold-inducible RNA-binding protein